MKTFRSLAALALLSLFLALPARAACTTTNDAGYFSTFVCTGTMNGTTTTPIGTYTLLRPVIQGGCMAVITADTGTAIATVAIFPSGLGAGILDTTAHYVNEAMPAVDTPTTNGSLEFMAFTENIAGTQALAVPNSVITVEMDSAGASDGAVTVTCTVYHRTR